MGIHVKMTKLVRVPTDNNRAKVKVETKLSEPFYFNVRVKQGAGLSPTLFNIALHSAVNKVDQKGNTFPKI